MNVTIPDSLSDFVSAQLATGKYSTASDFVCALLEKEKIRSERSIIDEKLLNSLDSSQPTELTSSDWDEMRGEVQRRQAARTGK